MESCVGSPQGNPSVWRLPGRTHRTGCSFSCAGCTAAVVRMHSPTGRLGGRRHRRNVQEPIGQLLCALSLPRGSHRAHSLSSNKNAASSEWRFCSGSSETQWPGCFLGSGPLGTLCLAHTRIPGQAGLQHNCVVYINSTGTVNHPCPSGNGGSASEIHFPRGQPGPASQAGPSGESSLGPAVLTLSCTVSRTKKQAIRKPAKYCCGEPRASWERLRSESTPGEWETGVSEGLRGSSWMMWCENLEDSVEIICWMRWRIFLFNLVIEMWFKGHALHHLQCTIHLYVYVNSLSIWSHVWHD